MIRDICPHVSYVSIHYFKGHSRLHPINDIDYIYTYRRRSYPRQILIII